MLLKTATGVVTQVESDNLVKVQVSREVLYEAHDNMGTNYITIDALNPVGAKKGQYVKFTFSEAGLGSKGIIGFGIPVIFILICGILGYILGSNYDFTPEMTSLAGMVIGGLIGVGVLRIYERMINGNHTKAEITEIIS